MACTDPNRQNKRDTTCTSSTMQAWVLPRPQSQTIWPTSSSHESYKSSTTVWQSSSPLIPAAGSEAATGPSYDRDAPRDAARSGMFGSMTRSVAEFAPCSLLCRRFNIKASHSGVSTGGHGQSPGPLVGRVGSTSDEVPRPGDKGDSAATGRGAGGREWSEGREHLETSVRCHLWGRMMTGESLLPAIQSRR